LYLENPLARIKYIGISGIGSDSQVYLVKNKNNKLFAAKCWGYK
jgi:hypothetical protein